MRVGSEVGPLRVSLEGWGGFVCSEPCAGVTWGRLLLRANPTDRGEAVGVEVAPWG